MLNCEYGELTSFADSLSVMAFKEGFKNICKCYRLQNGGNLRKRDLVRTDTKKIFFNIAEMLILDLTHMFHIAGMVSTIFNTVTWYMLLM